MSYRGAIKYNPRDVIECLEKYKVDLDIKSDSDAFREMVKDAKLGREIRFTINYNVKNRIGIKKIRR